MALDARRLMAAKQAAENEEEGDALHPPKGIRTMPKGIKTIPKGIKEETPPPGSNKKRVGNSAMSGAIQRRMAKNSRKQEDEVVSQRKQVGY